MTEKNKITIIGSGLAGSFLAVLLAKKGYSVTLYERLSQEEIRDAAAKRSYNIVLFGYGIEMLKKAQLWEIIKPHLLYLKGTVTHIANSKKPVISITDQKIPYFTITRAKLADIFLQQAMQHQSIAVHFDTALVSINRYEKTIVIQNTKTKKVETVPSEAVIGADGANSLVRTFIQQGQETNHRQEYADWIYKQFVLSEATIEKLGLEKQYVHVWTQKSAFIILHPISDGSLAALFVFPKKNIQEMQSQTKIANFFQQNFSDLMPALSEITPFLLDSADGNFATIHTNPWYYKDYMTIIGDAAHGFYPFFGQGASAAFGDCMKLSDLIDKYGADWEKIFPLYQNARKRHTDTLGELSKDVLKKYLRYKKADYTAIYDTVESSLYTLFPKLLHAPLFQGIITDPEHADDHWKNHLKQRKITKWVGIPLAVSLLTGIIASVEKTKNITRHKN